MTHSKACTTHLVGCPRTVSRTDAQCCAGVHTFHTWKAETEANIAEMSTEVSKAHPQRRTQLLRRGVSKNHRSNHSTETITKTPQLNRDNNPRQEQLPHLNLTQMQGRSTWSGKTKPQNIVLPTWIKTWAACSQLWIKLWLSRSWMSDVHQVTLIRKDFKSPKNATGPTEEDNFKQHQKQYSPRCSPTIVF